MAVSCVLGIGLAVAAVESLTVKVHRKIPHDPGAFTQGLLWWQGKLYESTGRRGQSQLRRIDPATGAVESQVRISVLFFGEGLARAGNRLVMLTWQAEQAFVFGLPDLDRLGTLSYRGEGWGLCHDGRRFVMSDGSDRLSFRDSESFAVVGQVAVTFEGSPLADLNELECVDGQVYANVFQRDTIVRIDPATGRVTARVDAAGLRDAGEAQGADVLNGIAYAPELGRFFVTGKLWPAIFEVTFVDESAP
ncbi:MAG: glutaminyl-peptide cyclotransferase [Gammaproteobacteria bacterium]|nr:glutaminyl-peptide cyclotransferase [Gammaproteobacteria bacterium]